MSRRRNALIATAFNYAQSALGILSAFYLTRLLIRGLGQDLYGLWLATGAVLVYAGLADLGILSVMPWLFAEADGSKDDKKMRSLLAHGVVAGVVGGVVYAIAGVVIWLVLPRLLHLSEVDRTTLRGPVFVMTAITAVTYPLRLISALRGGLQDYRFMGILALLQTLATLILTAALIYGGFGLYAIVLGSAVPPMATALAALARTMAKNPAILRDWPRPGWTAMRGIVVSGTGNWFASIGWQLAFASDSIVIAFLGHRDLIPMFAVTSRLGLTLMQLSWTLPDSTSVGLAQLNAEGHKGRVAEVVGVLLRLQLIGAGLIACGSLAGNVGFVSAWIGPDLFGGSRLNAVFALDVVLLSVVHGLAVPSAVLGHRMQVGVATLLNGAVHIGLALWLGRAWGLCGVAAATALSAIVTTIPICSRLLTGLTPLTLSQMVTGILTPWLVRAAPVFVAAAITGVAVMSPAVLRLLGRRGANALSVAAGVVAGFAYLLGMRPLMRDLPFGPKVRRLLGAFRLV
jgi:O-antigen/teichoic acid export membrane protein